MEDVVLLIRLSLVSVSSSTQKPSSQLSQPRVQKRPHAVVTRRPFGLVNATGIQCYFNSIMQCFFSNSVFMDELDNMDLLLPQIRPSNDVIPEDRKTLYQETAQLLRDRTDLLAKYAREAKKERTQDGGSSSRFQTHISEIYELVWKLRSFKLIHEISMDPKYSTKTERSREEQKVLADTEAMKGQQQSPTEVFAWFFSFIFPLRFNIASVRKDLSDDQHWSISTEAGRKMVMQIDTITSKTGVLDRVSIDADSYVKLKMDTDEERRLPIADKLERYFKSVSNEFPNLDLPHFNKVSASEIRASLTLIAFENPLPDWMKIPETRFEISFDSQERDSEGKIKKIDLDATLQSAAGKVIKFMPTNSRVNTPEWMTSKFKPRGDVRLVPFYKTSEMTIPKNWPDSLVIDMTGQETDPENPLRKSTLWSPFSVNNVKFHRAPHTYQLQSVSIHYGTSYTGGHHISYVRHRDELRGDEFLRCDDSRITTMPMEVFISYAENGRDVLPPERPTDQHKLGPRGNETPSLLFYVKIP